MILKMGFDIIKILEIIRFDIYIFLSFNIVDIFDRLMYLIYDKIIVVLGGIFF